MLGVSRTIEIAKEIAEIVGMIGIARTGVPARIRRE
jgi:hypothetical protein